MLYEQGESKGNVIDLQTQTTTYTVHVGQSACRRLAIVNWKYLDVS